MESTGLEWWHPSSSNPLCWPSKLLMEPPCQALQSISQWSRSSSWVTPPTVIHQPLLGGGGVTQAALTEGPCPFQPQKDALREIEDSYSIWALSTISFRCWHEEGHFCNSRVAQSWHWSVIYEQATLTLSSSRVSKTSVQETLLTSSLQSKVKFSVSQHRIFSAYQIISYSVSNVKPKDLFFFWHRCNTTSVGKWGSLGSVVFRWKFLLKPSWHHKHGCEIFGII